MREVGEDELAKAIERSGAQCPGGRQCCCCCSGCDCGCRDACPRFRMHIRERIAADEDEAANYIDPDVGARQYP